MGIVQRGIVSTIRSSKGFDDWIKAYQDDCNKVWWSVCLKKCLHNQLCNQLYNQNSKLKIIKFKMAEKYCA